MSIRVMARANTMELWQRAYCKVGERFADIIWRAFSRKFSSNASRHGPACAQQRAASISSFNADCCEPLNRGLTLVLLRHWLDDVIFAKFLDCRFGSDEAHPGVSRRNLNTTLFVLHITMNKGCTPAPRGSKFEATRRSRPS